jgi:hypothetical protein
VKCSRTTKVEWNSVSSTQNAKEPTTKNELRTAYYTTPTRVTTNTESVVARFFVPLLSLSLLLVVEFLLQGGLLY